MNKENIIIIGSGPAGYTAGIYASRAGLNPIIFTGVQTGGQLTTTTIVENFPGFPSGIDGFTLMSNMEEQAKEYGARIIYEEVTSVDFTTPQNHKVIAGGVEYTSKAVIICTGASAKYLGIPSEERLMNKGISTCAICDGNFFANEDVAVIGAGDSAFEEALYLSRICNSVTVLVRSSNIRASNIMRDRVLSNPKITVMLETQVHEFVGNDSLEYIVVNTNGQLCNLFVTGAFVAIGHTPNTSILNGVELDQDGYIINGHGQTTNVEGVFVAGDVCDREYKQAITASASGCIASLSAEKYLQNINE